MTRVTERTFSKGLTALIALLWVVAAGPVGAAGTSSAQSGNSQGVAKSTTQKSSSKATASSAPSKTSKKPTYSKSRSSARKSSLARARALRQQRELRELQTPRYRVNELGATVPAPRAEATIIYNPVTQEVLWEENATDPRSIASITKVMTAVVFLEHELDLDRTVTVDRRDVRRASVTYLRGGERLSVGDLLHLLLIASDNAAARTLARVSPFGSEGFIERMNDKAVELGLTSTHYADPSGLLSANVSSAFDMARLIAFAAGDERIAPIMRKADHRLTTSRRTITVHNTNKLVGSDLDVRGGKTGFISKAGYCLATLLRLPQSGDQVAVVVLGARSNAARFWETRHLFNWMATKTSEAMSVVGRSLEQ